MDFPNSLNPSKIARSLGIFEYSFCKLIKFRKSENSNDGPTTHVGKYKTYENISNSVGVLTILLKLKNLNKNNNLTLF